MEAVDTILNEGVEDNPAVKMLRMDHEALAKGQEAQFWLMPGSGQDRLVFWYLPKQRKIGASIVYLNDEDWEDVDDVYSAINRYAPADLKDFVEKNKKKIREY